MDISEIKKIELDILIDVASFCDSNNIKYVLFYGTLLGAVRHDGFIPWDDDIDIAMPRSDYENFVKTYSSSKYVEIDCAKSKRYFYPFAKVYDPSHLIKEKSRFDCGIGVYIDIFPIDSIDNTCFSKFKKKIWNLRKTWSRAIDIKNPTSKSLFRRLFAKIYNINKTNKLAKKMEKLAKEYGGESNIYIQYLECGNASSPEFDKELFQTQFIKFENHLFKCPKNYREVLTKLYGNYMELPPLEKRIYTHNFEMKD